MRMRRGLLIGCLVPHLAVFSCGPGSSSPPDASSDVTSADVTPDVGSGDAGSDACALSCSGDGKDVLDCNGNVVQPCTAGQACDMTTFTCAAACQAAANNKQSVGCDYYATYMEMDYPSGCFAAYVVNSSATAAHLSAELYAGTPLTVANFTRIPSSLGPTITYTLYDATAGLASGAAAVLFLGGSSTTGSAPCPIQSAATVGSTLQGTGKGHSFHITTDVPVAAYEINPFGGGVASVTGASLLVPTSAWDTNYMVVTAAPYSSITMDNPSLNIVAAADNTQVTILPPVAIVGGGTLAAGPANMPYTFTLNTGEQAQLSQQADLTGSIIQSTSPIGLMAGNGCMQIPTGTSFCDHGEQMIPPVKAIGHEYAGVMFRPRVTGDEGIWRVVGLVNGTELTYSTAVGGPSTLGVGQDTTFDTAQPFTVASQDSSHPFLLFANMSGSQWTQLSDITGYGDPDFVLVVPPEQWRSQYAFFVDPTFPEANLVVVRAKDATATFDDVSLDCAGTLTGWQAVGAYEWTRIDLVRHDFQMQNGCSAGPHTMTSKGPFGVTVWGWGTPETTTMTKYVSYGYPAGMGVSSLNSVVLKTQ